MVGSGISGNDDDDRDGITDQLHTTLARTVLQAHAVCSYERYEYALRRGHRHTRCSVAARADRRRACVPRLLAVLDGTNTRTTQTTDNSTLALDTRSIDWWHGERQAPRSAPGVAA